MFLNCVNFYCSSYTYTVEYVQLYLLPQLLDTYMACSLFITLCLLIDFEQCYCACIVSKCWGDIMFGCVCGCTDQLGCHTTWTVTGTNSTITTLYKMIIQQCTLSLRYFTRWLCVLCAFMDVCDCHGYNYNLSMFVGTHKINWFI